jgi:hypothetical protein
LQCERRCEVDPLIVSTENPLLKKQYLVRRVGCRDNRLLEFYEQSPDAATPRYLSSAFGRLLGPVTLSPDQRYVAWAVKPSCGACCGRASITVFHLHLDSEGLPVEGSEDTFITRSVRFVWNGRYEMEVIEEGSSQADCLSGAVPVQRRWIVDLLSLRLGQPLKTDAPPPPPR